MLYAILFVLVGLVILIIELRATNMEDRRTRRALSAMIKNKKESNLRKKKSIWD